MGADKMTSHLTNNSDGFASLTTMRVNELLRELADLRDSFDDLEIMVRGILEIDPNATSDECRETILDAILSYSGDDLPPR